MNGTSTLQWLIYHSRTAPEAIALTFQDREWTYARLARETIRCANHLQAKGISQGTRTAVISPNHPTQVILLHALILLGAVIVPINHKLSQDEVRKLVGNAGCQYICVYDESVQLIPDEILPGEVIQFSECENAIEMGQDSLPSIKPTRTEDICGIFYTSGTGGDPKGVTLSYSNFFMSAMASAINLGFGKNERWLACLPLDHIGGFSILMRSLIYGTTMILAPGFDKTDILNQMTRNSATMISVVPTMLHHMLNQDMPALPHLRAVLLGGGPARESLVEEALRRNLPVLRTYGMTETCSQVATMPLSEKNSPIESSGKVLPFTEIGIMRPDGSECDPGEVGEIRIQGPTVMEGYWRNPYLTNQKLVQGWLHTGDLGFFDEHGYLYVHTRKDTLIISGGENIAPEEIERTLKQVDDIADVSVVGIHDPRWGQAVAAAVVLSPASELTAEKLNKMSLDSLAPFKHPKYYHIVDSLPTTSLGKHDRKKIQEIIEQAIRGK